MYLAGPNSIALAHWFEDKVAKFSRQYVKMHILQRKLSNFYQNLTEINIYESNW